MFNGQISRVGDDLARTTLELVETMYEPGDEILTVLYGKDVTADVAAALAAAIEKAYPDLEVELKDGGQPSITILSLNKTTRVKGIAILSLIFKIWEFRKQYFNLHPSNSQNPFDNVMFC